MDMTLFEFPKEKIKSERASLIKEFVEAINDEREGTKYLPMSAKAIACKVGHIKELEDLRFLLSISKDSKRRTGSFGKCFFGSLKVREIHKLST